MQSVELEKINQVAKGIEDPHERIRHLTRSAWDIRRSYPKDALRLSLEARALAESLDFQEGIAYSFRNTGTAYYILSQYNPALADLEKAQALFTEMKDMHAIGSTLRNIGNVYHAMNLHQPAIEAYEKALAITRSENDLQGISYNLGNLGYAYQTQKQYARAKEYLLEGKKILEEIDDALGLSDLLNNLGKVLLAEGDVATGKRHIEQALARAQSINHLRGIAGTRLSLGQFYLLQKEGALAIAELKQALEVATEVGELTVIVEILLRLSEAYEANGDLKMALDYFKLYELKKTEIQKSERQVLIDTFALKSEMERSNLEKEFYKRENDELERAQKEIEEKNKDLERLSIVARETENPILILDADGTIDWVNASFERLNGCTLKEFKAKYGNTIQQASNNAGINDILKKCAETRKPLRYESPNLMDDGRVVWEATTLTPIFNAAGQLIKFIIIDDDVTERKQNEEIIKQKNKDITDSILYARQLQEAILPPLGSLTKIFPESFIFFKPKDIVSGDFCWFNATKEVSLVAVADCTGHGVPGAFMSVIGNEMLNASVKDPTIHSPSATLVFLDKKIKEVFTKGGQHNQTADGMDIGMAVWHYKDNLIQFAGAKRPLLHIRNKKVIELAGDRLSIGGKVEEQEKVFNDKLFYAEPGDLIYLFSDGYSDQFGGPRGKKFMHKNFVKLLCEISDKPMPEQQKELERRFEAWRGDLEQVDDVSVIGIKIKDKNYE